MLDILKIVADAIVTCLQDVNQTILTFSGLMQLVTVFFAISAYKKASRAEANREAMQQLADSIIRQQSVDER